MPNCVSEHCRKQLDERWPFCPYCGTDNRAPDQHYVVPEHKHEFLSGWNYCLRCGEAADEPYGMKRVWRVRLALVVLAVALFLGFSVFDLQLANMGKPALFKDWILSWYHSPISHYSRYGRSYTTELGSDASWWIAVAAIITGALAFAMLLKLPLGDRYSSRYADDDDGCLGRGCGCLGWLLWFWW